MEKYGIIVCPKCKKPKAVELYVKKTKCFSCNKNISLDDSVIIHKSNSLKEIQNAIGLLNAELDGNLEKFKEILKNNKFY
jgi:ribosome-associated translation inhibitor RaiA